MIEFDLRQDIGHILAEFGRSSGLASIHGLHSYRFRHFRIVIYPCKSKIRCEGAAGVREAADFIELFVDSHESCPINHQLKYTEGGMRAKLGPRPLLNLGPRKTRRRNLTIV